MRKRAIIICLLVLLSFNAESNAAELAPEKLAWHQAICCEWQKAIDSYTKALARSPRNAAWLARRGNAYAHLGRYKRAFADYSRAIECDINPHGPPGFHPVGRRRRSVPPGQFLYAHIERILAKFIDCYGSILIYHAVWKVIDHKHMAMIHLWQAFLGVSSGTHFDFVSGHNYSLSYNEKARGAPNCDHL
jgi:tetratricopeptide (TPR) repeat protein